MIFTFVTCYVKFYFSSEITVLSSRNSHLLGEKIVNPGGLSTFLSRQDKYEVCP
jgi:hypothetical protein